MAFILFWRNNNKNMNLFISLIFCILIIESSSIKIPMKSKLISSEQYNEINKDKSLRSLVQRDLEIRDYK